MPYDNLSVEIARVVGGLRWMSEIDLNLLKAVAQAHLASSNPNFWKARVAKSLLRVVCWSFPAVNSIYSVRLSFDEHTLPQVDMFLVLTAHLFAYLAIDCHYEQKMDDNIHTEPA